MLVCHGLRRTDRYWAAILFARKPGRRIARRAGGRRIRRVIDKESDAFLTLMLCLVLYRLPESFGPWILLPGLLRYLFVLFVKFAKPPQAKEQRTAKARWILFFMMLALLFSFAAYPSYLDYCRPLAALMTLALTYSFAESLYLMYRAPRWRENADAVAHALRAKRGDIPRFFRRHWGSYRKATSRQATLAYRLALIVVCSSWHRGCVGNRVRSGVHLFPLADAFGRIIGTDLRRT